MGKKRELLSHWQRVAKLVLAKEDVLTVSRALELALFYDAKLMCRKSRRNEMVIAPACAYSFGKI
jgi:hypothetical protein